MVELCEVKKVRCVSPLVGDNIYICSYMDVSFFVYIAVTQTGFEVWVRIGADISLSLRS